MSGLNPMARRQPVRYVGGKWTLAEWIISFFPPVGYYAIFTSDELARQHQQFSPMSRLSMGE